jgi:AcrR family transcriptional regulator
MAPRARSLDNSIIAHHAGQLLVEAGRDAITFAQVAERCGLAPPTLVQRFASRDGLLAATAISLRNQIPAAFLDARQPSPLAMLRSTLQALAPVIAAALELARSAGLEPFSLELRKQISFALAAAIEAGELPRCDVAALARTLQISATGAIAVAALERADAAVAVGEAFDTQLGSYI